MVLDKYNKHYSVENDMVLGTLVESTNENKLLKIEKILSENFQYSITFPTELNEMYDILNNISNKKRTIILNSNFNDYINNDNYQVLNLAEEALNLKIQIEDQNEKIK